MSSQKDKFLASAQKYIQKGQFDRALKDYEQVVTADPKDVKHRQKLAELMVRCNRREDAIREYETIAKYYDENGFYLKSIAVYKQIQRLDPSNIEISISLGALNEKQGMIGNALSEYKTVFDFYERSGRSDDAIKILEKMQSVDPENVDIRLKLAETCFRAGACDRAYQEFTRSALALKSRGTTAAFDRVCQRIQELFPDRTDSMVDILEEQIRNGVVADAVPKLTQLLQDDPDNVRVMGLLVEAYRISGNHEDRKELLQRILLINPDDLAAIKGIIDCSVQANDLEASLDLLDRYLPILFAAGSFGEVEHYFTTLQNHAPYDTRLLDGLRQLYELTGEKSKLADVEVSLNILSHKTSTGGREPSADVPAAGEVPGAGAAEFSWGDEIDLSNIAGLEQAETHETTEVEPAGLMHDFPLSGDTPAAEESRDKFEIDISFEFPADTEIFSADQTSSDEEPSPEKPEPAQELERLPDDAGADGAGLDFLEEITLDFEEIPEPGDVAGEQGAATLTPEDTARSPWEDFPSDIPPAFTAPDLPPEQEMPEFLPPPMAAAPVSPLPEGEAGAATDKYTFDGMFTRFKESLDQQVDSADTETHYNLGIAYMEMGLHDDAINEFRIAADDPNRRLDCLTLQGICCRNKGDYAVAEQVFSAGLAMDGLAADRILSLRYELGLLHEATGRREEALRTFREIFVTNPGFRDTMKKIALLSGKESSFDLSELDEVDIELEEID